MSKCPDGTGNSTFSLQKKSVFENSYDNEKEDVSYEVWGNKTKFYYDALGRRTQAEPNTRRYLFEAPRNWTGGKDKVPMTIVDFGKLLKEEIISTSACGNLKVDYGIIRDNIHVGGVTCPQVVPEAIFTPSQGWAIENGAKCDDGSPMFKLDNVEFSISPKRLAAPKMYVVPVGFKFEDGYITTQEDVDNLNKHELGHQKDIECLNFPTEKITISSCYCIKDLEEMRNNKIEEMKNIYYDIVKKAEKNYHDKYDYFGYPEIYECPR